VAALGPRTRVLAVSWVRFQDGLRLDLARLGAACAARGVALVVDGIQGAGTLPVTLDDPGGIAAFATGGHKGLLGPQGLGLLWTASGFRARLAPPGGWLSVEDALNFDRANTDFARGWVADGRRFEQGVPNLVATVALLPGLELIAETSPARIAAHVAALQRELCGALASGAEWAGEAARLSALLDADRLGSILALHHHGRGAEWLQRALRAAAAHRIYASIREGYLRIALHGWHDSADVARLAAWLGANE
jgi:selenocysteine lyase/cysteine desulfurase